MDECGPVDCAYNWHLNVQQVKQQSFALPVSLVPIFRHPAGGPAGFEFSAVIVTSAGQDHGPVLNVTADICESVAQLPMRRLAPKQAAIARMECHL